MDPAAFERLCQRRDRVSLHGGVKIYRGSAGYVAGKRPDDLVFTGIRGGGPLRVAVFRHGGFDTAAKVIGLPGLHPHELRHTAASLAIASGADVKVIQQMLGHSSATMTMDTYALSVQMLGPARLRAPTRLMRPAQQPAPQLIPLPRPILVLPQCCPGPR